MNALFRVSLLFAWLRLCQNQATCAQPEAIAHRNSFTAVKKSEVAVLIFNSLILKIRINHRGYLPQLSRYAFKRLLNLTDKNLFSLRTPTVKGNNSLPGT